MKTDASTRRTAPLGTEVVLDYLSRYTHRVAVSDEQVQFRYWDSILPVIVKLCESVLVRYDPYNFRAQNGTQRRPTSALPG